MIKGTENKSNEKINVPEKKEENKTTMEPIKTETKKEENKTKIVKIKTENKTQIVKEPIKKEENKPQLIKTEKVLLAEKKDENKTIKNDAHKQNSTPKVNHKNENGVKEAIKNVNLHDKKEKKAKESDKVIKVGKKEGNETVKTKEIKVEKTSILLV